MALIIAPVFLGLSTFFLLSSKYNIIPAAILILIAVLVVVVHVAYKYGNIVIAKKHFKKSLS